MNSVLKRVEQIVFPTVYTTIVYFMSDQPLDVMRFFMFLLMGILISLVAQSLGIVIGAAMDIQVTIQSHLCKFMQIYANFVIKFI